MRRFSLIAPSKSNAPALRTPEQTVPSAETNDVLRRFNRDTGRLTTLVVGAAVSAAFMMAVLVQDRHPTAVGLPEEARHAGDEVSPNANSGTLLPNLGLPGKVSPDEITTGQARSVDHSFIETIPKEDTSPQAPASTSASAPPPPAASARRIPTVTLPANDKIVARAVRRKIRSARYLSLMAPRSGGVKLRLVALQRESLARSGKSPNWAGFLSLNGKSKKKAAYTAETNR
jgi:hypothetical protein